MGGPRRPVLRWHGGKWTLAPWIVSHFPPHRTYVEPFGGAASVLLRKKRSYAEVYNDLNDEVVTLFRILRSDRAVELTEALRLTPYSRKEFRAAYDPTEDDLEIARRLVVRAFMGFGSSASNKALNTGFRSDSNKSGSTPATDWKRYPDHLHLIVERLRGVVIENRPALSVLSKHDRPDALHYVDPPYLPETRGQAAGKVKHPYTHEMSVDDHEELIEACKNLHGMVVISGYRNDLYSRLLSAWSQVETVALADGARRRTEVLWMSPTAASNLSQEKQISLI